MFGELIPIVLFIMFFGVIGYITRVISDNRVRRELVSLNADKETIDYLFLRARSENPDGSLKWGIVSVALGAALALIQLLGLAEDQPMTYALLFIFGGSGLLGFYALKTTQDNTDS